MNNFTLPFEVKSETKDYVLSKLYDQKDSYLLKIPAGKHIEQVINIRIKPTGHDLSFTLNVKLEACSSAVIIEDWACDVESENVNFTHHIECMENSNLKYVILNSASDKTTITENRSSDIHSDSRCDIYSYYFGSRKVNSKLVQRAVGKGASVFTDIIAKSENEQDMNFDCEHKYIGRNGNGEIGMKAVVKDRAMMNLDGMINIEKTGGGSAGYLKQETLNLSQNTQVKATPGLKIEHNDVKAGHGSSIRNLNDEDLYYFAARGIDEETAKNLLIRSFLGSELGKIQKWDTVYTAVKKLI